MFCVDINLKNIPPEYLSDGKLAHHFHSGRVDQLNTENLHVVGKADIPLGGGPGGSGGSAQCDGDNTNGHWDPNCACGSASSCRGEEGKRQFGSDILCDFANKSGPGGTNEYYFGTACKTGDVAGCEEGDASGYAGQIEINEKGRGKLSFCRSYMGMEDEYLDIDGTSPNDQGNYKTWFSYVFHRGSVRVLCANLLEVGSSED